MPSEKSKEEGFLAKTLRIISEELPQFVQSQAIPFTGKKDGKESVMNTDMVAEERAVLEGILKAGLLVAPGAGAAAKVAQQFPRATGAAASAGSALASGDPADALPGLGGIIFGSQDAQAMNIGSKALTWDKELEALTKELRAAGYSNREVVANGGMWQAPVDNKYRQEISDALSKVNTDVSGRGPLRAVLDHPELYKAYPWLQHVPVEIKQGARAFIRDAGPDAIQRFMISLPKGAERKTVLHETQHAIQNAEGWAKGGSPEMFKGTEMFSRDVAEALSKPGSYAIPEDILAALYRRLAGEAEARIIEASQYIKQEHLPQNFFGDFYDVDQAKLLDADRIK